MPFPGFPDWNTGSSGHILFVPSSAAKDHIIDKDAPIAESFLTCFSNANYNIADVVQQYGKYKHATFRFILINDPGYVNFLCKDYETRDLSTLKSECANNLGLSWFNVAFDWENNGQPRKK